MSYKADIPKAKDKIKISQGDLKENFSQIKTVFENNHSAFTSATAGRHGSVAFVDQEIPPALDPTTTNVEFALYAKQSTRTNQLELFTRRANDGAVYGITEANAVANGWGMTSSGMLVQWGTANASGASAPINFGIAFPTICVGVWMTVLSAAGDANRFVELSGSPGLASFTVYAGQRTAVSTPAATDFYFVAIGF